MFDDDGTPPAPAREIFKRGKQKKVNYVTGKKLTGVQQTESLLESNIVMVGEIDPRVELIRTQPCTFDLNTGRRYPTRKAAEEAGRKGAYKPRIYTPDTLFTLNSGAEVYVEGKHTKWLADKPDYLDDLEMLREVGHRVLLVTERAFSPTLVRNVRLLKPYVSRPPSADTVSMMQAALTEPICIGDLVAATGVTQPEVLSGIACGIIRFDLASPALGPRSIIELATSTSHLEIFAI